MSTTTSARKQLSARRTTVALKIATAVTGLFFLLFVLAHMYGNLKMFSGQEAFDGYAHHLRVLGEPLLPYSGFLWLLRIALIVSVVVHVAATFALWRRANRARSHRYVVRKAVTSSLSSRTMRWGGVALLAFIIFHLLQFTTLTIEVGGSFDSPYQRMIAGFSEWYILAIYVLAMVALGMHLRHGVWSATQTLGWSTGPRARALKQAAVAIAIVVVIGYLLPPLAIFFGLIS